MVSDSIFSVFKFSVASVNCKTLFFQGGNFRFFVSFGSLKMPYKIGTPFSFTNFSAIIVQFSFKKMVWKSQKFLGWPLIF